MNPDHIIVSRIEVVEVRTGSAETIAVLMKRTKSLTIENYAAENAWKSAAPAE